MRQSDVSAEVQMQAAVRVLQGEDPKALSREFAVSTTELLRWSTRLQAISRKEAEKDARKKAIEATRETLVEERVRRHLTDRGYSVERRLKRTGPDVIAHKDGKSLLVEVKADRPGHVDNSATVNVDVLTLLGQVVMAKGQQLADEYAVAVRPIHMRLLTRAMPVLRELGIKVLLVEDDDIRTISG